MVAFIEEEETWGGTGWEVYQEFCFYHSKLGCLLDIEDEMSERSVGPQ